MATPGKMRFTYIVWATVCRLVIRTAGMPLRSRALASADPQREHVPQVEVMSAPPTPALLSSGPTSSAIRSSSRGSVPLPVVA